MTVNDGDRAAVNSLADYFDEYGWRDEVFAEHFARCRLAERERIVAQIEESAKVMDASDPCEAFGRGVLRGMAHRLLNEAGIPLTDEQRQYAQKHAQSDQLT